MVEYGPENLGQLNWLEMTSEEYRELGRSRLRETRERGNSGPWRSEFLSSRGDRVPVLVEAARLANDERFAGVVLHASGPDRSEQDFGSLSGRLLHAHDQERRRIARELHDTTAQNLAALSMNLLMLAGVVADSERGRAIVSECNSLTEECLKEVRSLSYMLHPPLLDELGLDAALKAYAGAFERRTGVKVWLNLTNHIGRLRQELELGAFRMIQESLDNVHRHSGSDRVEIQLTRSGDHVELSIRDWGKGLDAETVRGMSLGIAGMRERARLLRGEIAFAAANPGALVRARFPLEL